jgi:pimeloyl-ACP methyl ester carboxylesterase
MMSEVKGRPAVATGTNSVSLQGHRLRYLDVGSGDVVVFIHGLLGSHRSWADLVDRLEDGYRVVAPDLFGHGGSAKHPGDYSLGAHAATLRELLDHLGVDRVTIVGHSLGGGIAMQFQYLFPQRVRRLVLVSSGGLGRHVSPLLRAAALPGAEYVIPVIAARWLTTKAEAAGHGLSRVGWRASSALGETWRGFTSLAEPDSRRAFLATTRAVIDVGGQRVSARDYLSTAPGIPTLIVWGAKDRVIPVAHAASAAEMIDGCQLQIFEGSGHFPHLDEPGRFAAVLRQFASTP